MDVGDGVLRGVGPQGRPTDGVAIRSLGWLSLSAALPGLVCGILLFLYYLSNLGIDSLFNALQGRWFDLVTLAGLCLSAFSCIVGGALTLRGRRRHTRLASARWAFWLGLAGLLAPLTGVVMLVVTFIFLPW